MTLRLRGRFFGLGCAPPLWVSCLSYVTMGGTSGRAITAPCRLEPRFRLRPFPVVFSGPCLAAPRCFLGMDPSFFFVASRPPPVDPVVRRSRDARPTRHHRRGNVPLALAVLWARYVGLTSVCQPCTWPRTCHAVNAVARGGPPSIAVDNYAVPRINFSPFVSG